MGAADPLPENFPAWHFSPVETVPQALIQNLFSLVAVSLVLIRVTTLLAQLQTVDFQTRTSVEPCLGWRNNSITTLDILVYQREHERFDISISVHVGVIDSASKYFCTLNSSLTVSVWHSATPNDTTDKFDLYKCPEDSFRSDSIKIIINDTNWSAVGDSMSDWGDYPTIWLSPGVQHSHRQPFDRFVPYLVPALRSLPMKHTIAEVNYALRRFIVSPGILDAITGSKPTYQNLDLYLLNPILTYDIPSTSNSSNPKENPATTMITLVPNGSPWTSSRSATQVKLERGRDELCEVTEDYRLSNTFDILASIGGLLAFLQGIHIFLFGRPLFWGMFGAKLLMPFGIVGRMATANFRQRLRDHYHSSNIDNPDGPETRQEDNINMNRFLLDYVLDLGPATPDLKCTDNNLSQEQSQKSNILGPKEDNDHELEVEMKGLSTETSSIYSRLSTTAIESEGAVGLDTRGVEPPVESERLPVNPRRLSDYSVV